MLGFFLRLILAHILADFVFQPHSWIEERKKAAWRAPTLWAHSAISGATAYVLAWRLDAWWLVGVVGVTHLLLDAAKTRTDYGARAFILDQSGHIAVAAGSALALAGVSPAEAGAAVGLVTGSAGFWAVVTGYCLVLRPSGMLVGLLTAPLRQQIETTGRADGDARVRGLEKAGMWIGQIERFLVLTFVLVGRYEAIGFLVAAKSILRFGEVRDSRDRQEIEYILVGTMLSFAVAIVVGVAVRSILVRP